MDVSRLDPTTHFFKDGMRKIDFVLVLKKPHCDNQLDGGEPIEVERMPLIEDTFEINRDRKLKNWRQKFMRGLLAQGLEVEEEFQEDTHLHVIKLNAPFDVLCQYAEDLNMEAPLEVFPEIREDDRIALKTLSKFWIPHFTYQVVPYKPKRFYTTSFRANNIDKIIGKDDPSSFFSSAQRSLIVHHILSNIAFGDEKEGEVGIEGLVAEEGYLAAYPLHDGPFKDTSISINDRRILYDYWAKWGKWYKQQPLRHIRKYFGEKVAFYFAWLGLYTSCLLPATIVGLLVFCYGIITVSNDKITTEICDQSKNITLCPDCFRCPTVELANVCFSRQAGYVFDNYATLLYTFFMSLWTVTFLKLWKRKSATLACEWNCIDLKEVEKPRPEFARNAPNRKTNKVTEKEEPYFPYRIRVIRKIIGSGVTLLMAIVVMIALISICIYHVFMVTLLEKKDITGASTIAGLTGAILQVICIEILNYLYERIAMTLTKWEMHRTQSEFDDNLCFKIFLFQFMNFYSSLFYIAFFKGKFVGYPGNYNFLFTGVVQLESCSMSLGGGLLGGCQYDLMIQMISLFTIDQIIGIILEFVIPKICGCCNRRKSNLHNSIGKSQIKQDLKLAENDGLLNEYMKLILQFSSVTMFVAAFPLGPFFAIINNWIEIRLDAQKFLCDTRRVHAESASDIGIWHSILTIIAKLSVTVNALQISFTSDFIEAIYFRLNKSNIDEDYTSWILTLSPKEYTGTPCYYAQFRDDAGNLTITHWKILAIKLAFVVLYQNVVFGLAKLIDLVVPDIPKKQRDKGKRQHYLSRQNTITASVKF